ETGKQAVEGLLEALPTLPEWARVVFVERGKLADSNKILKLAQNDPNGYEKAFITPKDSTSWIVKRAKDAYQTTIEPAAPTALASVTVAICAAATTNCSSWSAMLAANVPSTKPMCAC